MIFVRANASFSDYQKMSIDGGGGNEMLNKNNKLNSHSIDKQDVNIWRWIYPNPSSGQYTYTHSNKIQSAIVYNSYGKIVLEFYNVNTNLISFNISSHPQGIYYLKTTCNSKTLVMR